MNSKRREGLQKKWYEAIMHSYFPNADAAFFSPIGFANPIGQNFQQATTAVVNGLADGANLDELKAPLDRIIRILAVQGLPAGMSIRFLTEFRRQLDTVGNFSPEEKAFWIERIDTLSEMAVEILLECRETLSLLRINELRNRILQLEAGFEPREKGRTT